MSTPACKSLLKRNGIFLIALWTAINGLLLGITITVHHKDTLKEARSAARDYFDLVLHYRSWAAKMGGLYVPVDKVTPNPYLKNPGRDITTSDNRQLTLVNPAYMTRMVFESIFSSSPDPIISKLVSLNPLNPVNSPDEWVKRSLEAFERKEYREHSEVTSISGKPYLRFISTLVTEKSCLKCHSEQGYREGDIRGAIAISIPLAKAFEIQHETDIKIFGGYLFLWILGSTGILFSSRRRFLDEEIILASERKFRTICDWTQDWEYWLGPDGKMIYVSPSCLEITGYSQDEFMNDPKLFIQIMHPDYKHSFADHRLRLPTPETSAELLEYQIITRSGELRWVQHHCRPIFDGETFIGRRASNRDITDRKHAEEEKRELERQLHLSQKLESLGVLAGGIAHDFNNILAVIIGHCGLVKLRPEMVDQSLPQIEKSAERAAELVRQMLAYAGKAQFVITLFDLTDLVDDMVKMLRTTIPHNIVLNSRFSATSSLIEGDSGQIRHIIMHLTMNAWEAIEEAEGEIAINLENRESKKKGEEKDYFGKIIPAGKYACIEVTDNGNGMDNETQGRIFEPFYSTKFTGRGLGMSAALGIIRAHKGFVQLESTKGKGSVFRIFLKTVELPEN